MSALGEASLLERMQMTFGRQATGFSFSSLGWPVIYHVDQAGLRLEAIFLLQLVLGFQVCALKSGCSFLTMTMSFLVITTDVLSVMG